MSTVAIRRSARRPAPPIPSGDVAVPAPPALATGGQSRWTHVLMAIPMLAGTIATAFLFAGRQGGAYSYVVGGVFGLSSLGMLATSMATGAGRRDRIDTAGVRREYADALGRVRTQVRANATALRAALTYRHPAPSVLVTLVDSGRLWERRNGDADFGAARVGLGPQELTTPLVPAPGTTDDLDPIGLAAMRRLLDVYATVPDLPVAVATAEFARVYANDAGLVRSLIAQLTFAHAPGDLLVAVCAEPDRMAGWDYLKWLPHHQHPRLRDATGPMRLAATRLGDLETLLADVIEGRSSFAGNTSSGPRLIVVVDGADRTAAKRLGSSAGIAGCCVIELDASAPADSAAAAISLIVADDGRLLADGDDVGAPDDLSIVEAEALARALAPIRLVEDVASRSQAAHAITLDGLLGLTEPLAASIKSAWVGRSAADRLRVPIGVQSSGRPVLLDLKEAARDGMGPHGLLIGATGSGKSELLRTLVLSLAASHDSETLNFVLIDFKGGATFASLDRLPHTAAVITNLADELPLVDRMTDALNGELVRRQEILRRVGNLASLHDYERVRATNPTLEPLPVLLIVCDEFSELLSAKPEFIDLFVAIGRLGRSLGVHLLLASQRLDEGRLRGLDTHLSYRIGLRTFSAMESRAVLGVEDAYKLPRSPGHGYLKYGNEPLVRFKAAYSSGPMVLPAPMPAMPTVPTGRLELVPFSSAPIRPTASVRPVPAQPSATTLLDAMTDAMAGAGIPAHRVWLPPLSTSDPLDALLGPLERHPTRGLTVADASLHGTLRIPVAVIDKPYEQRRDPLWLSLDAAAGHVAIVGGPQSGKSSLVRTLIAALALTHTPREVTCYCLDFGGGTLRALSGLPHVGAVVGRLGTEAVRRTVGDVATLLATRERQFATDRVEDIGEARKRTTPLDPYGDVFLVIDGWATVHSDYDDLEPLITDIATRGLSYGVHVVITAGRWADLRPALRDLLGTRLELRLGDPGDSQVNRKIAGTVPLASPGRGLTLDSRHFLAAAPRLAAGSSDDLVTAIADGWTGPGAPAVRELPALVPYAQLATDAATGLALPIGIAESDLRSVSIDFAADPHLLIFGEPGSGKSSALRAFAAAIIARYPPERARIVVLDYRRSMLGEIDGEHLIGYATADGPAATLLGSVADYMQRRLPGPDVTPRELRARSWWSGPECFVLIDDYDLVATGTNPVLVLLEYLSQAGDVGLHVIIARRSGGAARALFEPVIARLRELATPGLILSGDREEGALVGTVRPQPLPPGRATLVDRRDGARLVQLGYLAPLELAAAEDPAPVGDASSTDATRADG